MENFENTFKNFSCRSDLYSAFNQSMEVSSIDIDASSIQEVDECFKNPDGTLYVLIMASYPKEFCENFLGMISSSYEGLSSGVSENS